MKRRGLGRGFEALMGAGENIPDSDNAEDHLELLPVESIQRGPYQPRTHFEPDALQQLADSIRVQGILQPVVVRRVGDGYELIAGERRWRAAQIAELQEIPAIVKDMPDENVAAVALIENIQRENLNPLEQANAIHRLIEEFGLTHQQAAEAIGRSRTAVTNLLRLLELSDKVKPLVQQGQLDMGHARAILTLAPERQFEIARQAAEKGLSVRETEALARKAQTAEPAAKKPQKNKQPDIVNLERELSDQIGAQVEIHHRNAGSGKLIINYKSTEEFDGILQRLK